MAVAHGRRLVARRRRVRVARGRRLVRGLPAALLARAVDGGAALRGAEFGRSRFPGGLRMAGLRLGEARRHRHARLVPDAAAEVPDAVGGGVPRAELDHGPAAWVALRDLDVDHAAVEARFIEDNLHVGARGAHAVREPLKEHGGGHGGLRLLRLHLPLTAHAWRGHRGDGRRGRTTRGGRSRTLVLAHAPRRARVRGGRSGHVARAGSEGNRLHVHRHCCGS
mmetsp:Transcript_81777/g.210612  ORF Transcript_81777/g.210612 Transcript_81777/m.210612 type:complete len:223 (+) Transcript_81777:352-1020(+)